LNFHRNTILLLANLVAGSFLLFLVAQADRWAEPLWFGVVRELFTIPFLLALVVVTVLSLLEVRKKEFNWKSDVFISLVFGLLVFIILVFNSVSDL